MARILLRMTSLRAEAVAPAGVRGQTVIQTVTHTYQNMSCVQSNMCRLSPLCWFQSPKAFILYLKWDLVNVLRSSQPLGLLGL